MAVLSHWNRHQAVRIVGAMLAAWLLGSTGIHLAERGNNPAFNTWTESFYSVWVMLFSGLDTPPGTTAGRLLSMIVLGAGVGLAGLFTGTVASILVERQLRRSDVANFEMDDHLVLCNWGPRGLAWIREVHSKIIQNKRPVVIIHDETEQILLPDKQDDPAFNDVYIVKGDTTNEVVLRRARVPGAHSVVILTDDRQGTYADGKTILTCIAIRDICRGGGQPNIAVECQNPNNHHRLLKAGADEVISSDELGLRLLARTALYHGMTRVYQELLTVGRDANEMYLFPVPEELVGRDFVEVSSMFLRHRDGKRSCLLIGLQRGEEMILNPIGTEAGPIEADDQLILLSRVFLAGTQALPTVPPITPTRPSD
ncbi:MAG: potassium channel protein [Planctomycetaceae bacterium]|nr:potassium channel protein [Planctomycetaceae bacterium]MBV8314858.1 potassium channel protein [Planctomycetaceae bacterium]MBV8607960.1 potassium channel protein [Singulisphaera sp.]MBV8677662.1 potassium channel protein [Planctomycetaceae bacterium]